MLARLVCFPAADTCVHAEPMDVASLPQAGVGCLRHSVFTVSVRPGPARLTFIMPRYVTTDDARMAARMGAAGRSSRWWQHKQQQQQRNLSEMHWY
jgi:hypothetical protein